MAVLIGLVLFAIARKPGDKLLSDLLFCVGSGMLLVGLVRLLSNLRAFASFSWGMRFLKRLFRNEARSSRAEADDYAAYRNSLGRHGDAPVLLILALLFFALSALTAR